MAALLPELVTEILLRLPVRSLLRFRCLSTSLCAEIDTPDFIKNHLSRSIQSRTHQKLIFYDSCPKGTTDFYCADFDDDLKALSLLSNPLKSPHRCRVLCGSCNGLLLLSLILHRNWRKVDLAMWNPFTRRYRKIPLCPLLTLSEYEIFTRFGLGYDSALDDYKAVMISKVHDSKQVWVFSLKSNSWRMIKDVRLVEDHLDQWPGVFANGALYWNGEKEIIGFDLTNEVFFKIPKLSDCGPTAICLNRIVLFGGNLYMPVLRAERKTIEFYSYATDKVGQLASGSWRKEFTIEEEVRIRYNRLHTLLLAYSKEMNSILLLSNENGFFLYNLEDKTRQRVEIPGMLDVQANMYHVCLESLVSLGNDSAFDGAAEEVMV